MAVKGPGWEEKRRRVVFTCDDVRNKFGGPIRERLRSLDLQTFGTDDYCV